MIVFELKEMGVKNAENEILKKISLLVTEGEHLTITGPSGSGKSTLLKVLSTLQNYHSGEIFYCGQDLTTLDPVFYRREVSYCFQQPVLFGTTVRDNLEFPFKLRKLEFDEKLVLTKLSVVNLDENFLEKPITELSGGEKQRIALVRNLLFQPKVLLLDEVTAGLDADNKAIVRRLIEQMRAEGTTILEVTHDASEISGATRLVRIEGGELRG